MAEQSSEDVRTDEQLAEEVTCFGRYWDPAIELCTQECAIQARCVARLATVVLPRVAAELGKAPAAVTRRELEGADVSVSAEALAWLRRVHDAPELGLPVRGPDGVLGPPEPASGLLAEDPEDELETSEADDAPDEEEEPTDPGTRRKKPDPPEALADPKGQPRRAKRGPKKSEDGRAKKKRRSKPQKPPRTWGPHTFPGRWMRERANNRFVARVPIGWTLSRVWKGELHTTTCREGYWEYREQRLPTLYSVVEAITGVTDYPPQKTNGVRPEHRGRRTMAAWSARRFFQLDQTLEKHGLHPDQQAPRHSDPDG